MQHSHDDVYKRGTAKHRGNIVENSHACVYAALPLMMMMMMMMMIIIIIVIIVMMMRSLWMTAWHWEPQRLS
jgi:uncharacterized membrane protein